MPVPPSFRNPKTSNAFDQIVEASLRTSMWLIAYCLMPNRFIGRFGRSKLAT